MAFCFSQINDLLLSVRHAKKIGIGKWPAGSLQLI
jgi:hypothetical protein